MILCCGEALIDMIPHGTTAGRDGFVPFPGGAVFNTAIALGRLGAPAGLLTGLSSDLFGRQLRDALHASHVDSGYAITSDRHTTLAFVQLQNGHATYEFYDENSAGRMLAPADMPEIGPEVAALFFGGISLMSTPCADAYASLLDKAGNDRAVMLDPNIRPGFITDPEAYRARLTAMLARTDIVKVSDEDLDWLLPDAGDLPRQIASLHDMGPALVVLTRGKDGATGYLSNGTEVSVAATPVEVADTVGAGDTFNAGLLASLSALGALTPDSIPTLSEDDLRAALTLGTRAAAITVSRSGANPPWPKELG